MIDSQSSAAGTAVPDTKLSRAATDGAGITAPQHWPDFTNIVRAFTEGIAPKPGARFCNIKSDALAPFVPDRPGATRQPSSRVRNRRHQRSTMEASTPCPFSW